MYWVKISEIWKNFYVARLSLAITSVWQSCLTLIFIRKHQMFDITQVVLKRLMHVVVKQLTCSLSASNKCISQALTDRDENAIRYMAGYVIVKLRKTSTQCMYGPWRQWKQVLMRQMLSHCTTTHVFRFSKGTERRTLSCQWWHLSKRDWDDLPSIPWYWISNDNYS